MRISDWSSDVCSSDLWVVRFNARGPEGLLDGKAPGARSRLNDAQRQALAEVVERGPIPAIHGVVRWRLIDLVQWLHDEFAVSLDETNVGRELRKLGYGKLTARPRPHAQVGRAPVLTPVPHVTTDC